MTRFERVVKRSLDILVAAAALPALSPVMALVAVWIKLDSPGPILFRQERLGLGGRLFRILKFRTMREGAPVLIDPTGKLVNEADDLRHTRVGKFLRRFSLDELPQLVNVLRGEMSLVGPRPDLPEGLRYYDDHQRNRLAVRPGITGLAQVSGRNEQGSAERWNLDAEYALSYSLRLDMRILRKTLGIVARCSGVYKRTGP